MKKRVFALAAALSLCFTACLMMLGLTASAADSPKVFLLDQANVISQSDENRVQNEAQRVADKTGFNIVIVASDDIGTPKTDAHTVEYADDTYEQLCGIDTDGILFLINCDTKYDYISTSGVCINYFSDARIDKIFDAVWDDLVDGSYGDAAYKFLGQVEKYYDKGKANNQDIHTATDEYDVFAAFIATLGVPLVTGGIIGLITFIILMNGYKLQKPETKNYILDNSLVFDVKADNFLGRFTRTIYTPRSSSSGGSHHSSGHSSTHHSRSGGTHGGGGRHR